jgi:PAS domain S-box-containing protein
LEKQNNLAQSYFNRADAFMIAIGSDEVITDINGKASEILGYSRKQVKGKKWFDTFVPEAKEKRLNAFFTIC